MPKSKFPKKPALALLIASLVAIVASSQVVSAGYAYQPPSGWTKLTGTQPGLGVWVHPDKKEFRQNISILAQRYGGTLDAFTNRNISRLLSNLPQVQMGHIEHVAVCRSHPATYISYAGTIRGKQLVYEQIATIWQGIAYVATYARLSTQPMIDSARHSLTTMCGGTTTSQGRAVRSGLPATQSAPSPTTAPSTANPNPQPTYGQAYPTVTP